MTESVSNLTIPYDELADGLRSAPDTPALYHAVVNLPFQHPFEMAQLFLSFITFNLVDESAKEIYFAGASDTEGYELSIKGYNFDPSTYRIPLDDPKSTLAKAINSGESHTTKDWNSLSRPNTSEDTVRLNQASGGITFSVVYPLLGAVRGALMYNFAQYQGAIGEEQRDFMSYYTDIVSEALDQRS